MGLTDFSAQTQDLMAVDILRTDKVLLRWKREIFNLCLSENPGVGQRYLKGKTCLAAILSRI
jgi:hypothetical protein